MSSDLRRQVGAYIGVDPTVELRGWGCRDRHLLLFAPNIWRTNAPTGPDHFTIPFQFTSQFHSNSPNWLRPSPSGSNSVLFCQLRVHVPTPRCQTRIVATALGAQRFETWAAISSYALCNNRGSARTQIEVSTSLAICFKYLKLRLCV
jgi:hypothetical protein